jgi:hypothetical protein
MSNPEILWDPDDPAEVIAKNIVDSAFHVHRALGPGLLESVYQRLTLVSCSSCLRVFVVRGSGSE